eukprot:6206937-Pleurochrysis_carterae.AAC.2
MYCQQLQPTAPCYKSCTWSEVSPLVMVQRAATPTDLHLSCYVKVRSLPSSFQAKLRKRQCRSKWLHANESLQESERARERERERERERARKRERARERESESARERERRIEPVVRERARTPIRA